MANLSELLGTHINNISAQLIKYKLVADGSFLWEFELKNGGIVPLLREAASRDAERS